jgi:hypothetical protein
MDAAEILDCSGQEPPGVEGSAWSERPVREVGKSSLAPGLRLVAREAMGAYKPLAKSRPAGRVAGGP